MSNNQHHFKIWNKLTHNWIEDYLDDYIELNWYFSGNKCGECWPEPNKKHWNNIVLVYPDENGNFISPED